MNLRNLAIGIPLTARATAGGRQPSVQLYAAGSLRAPMTEIVQAYTASGRPAVTATYGASGLLRARVEKGEPADVFASVDVGNPQELARAGRATAPVVFARNRPCALVAPGMAANSDTLLNRILDPQVKLGTSIPKADPSGDYARQVFDKAEQLRPGALKTLDTKALKLTGGPNCHKLQPTDRSMT